MELHACSARFLCRANRRGTAAERICAPAMSAHEASRLFLQE